jgi:fibro-slime domain-containing protein
MPVYFRSALAHVTLPASGSVDVAGISDTVYVDGTGKSVVASGSMTSAGVCFDSLRTVLIRSPWSGTVPVMVANGDSIKMHSVSGYCGWYAATYFSVEASIRAYFKPLLGADVYTSAGLAAGAPVALDSIAAAADSVWIKPYPYPSGTPALASSFPGGLSECSRSIAVMVFDWLGESEKNNVTDPDFGIGSGECGGGDTAVKGMVLPVLGADELPVRNNVSFPSGCTAAKDLNHWFIADTVQSLPTATCRDIAMTLDSNGFWVADIAGNENAGVPGFFPIDDFKYLDDANTVVNPKWDSVQGKDWQGYHNYSFSMKVQAEFKYVKGQTFEFRGDDDVWVFIDDRLVVDLGGKHGPIQGAVELDTIGRASGDTLVEGNTYPFHIFYAERSKPGSNFMMRTTMDLQTERTYYPVRDTSDAALIKYEFYQIVKGKSLTCDYSKTVSADTSLASSLFTLTGGGFGDSSVTLVNGVSYSGIVVDSSSFTVDTSLIILNRSLAPGVYCLRFTLAADTAQSGEVYFTIPEYPLPTIAFADSAWNEIAGDTVTAALGEWAATPYRVNVGIFYMGVPCSICTETLQLNADSLVFVDSLLNEIHSVALDSGRATFWVMSRTSVEKESFTVSGDNIANTLLWTDITLREPPVPQAEFAGMYDRDGNGIPDSLYLKYSRAIVDKDSPDSLLWVYGDSTAHFLDSASLELARVGDSALSFVSIGGDYMKSVFTGLQSGIYSGTSQTWFTYVSDSGATVVASTYGKIQDKVGPVLLGATVSLSGDKMTVLTLTFSEALAEPKALLDSLFEYKLWKSGARVYETPKTFSSDCADGYRYRLYFNSVLGAVPAVGDSVRFAPGVAKDLNGNSPHAKNPWVRVFGEQKVQVGSSDMVTLPVTPDTGATQISLEEPGKTAKEISREKGTPGYLISYDMGELLANANADRDTSLAPLTPDSIKIHYEMYYFTNLGEYVNSVKGDISCSDSIFGGDCTAHKGNVFLGWTGRSSSGRLAGTGAYIAHLSLKVRAGNKTVSRSDEKSVWGVRRPSK